MVSGAAALFAGLYYWLPKITGKMYDEFLGKLHFVVFFIGFNLLYFPMFTAWETPRRVFEYAPGLTSQHQLASIGGFILGFSFFIMFYNLFKSLVDGEEAGNNPWEYSTSAEWAVSSPPPLENFPGTPSYADGKLTFRDEPETETTTAPPDGATAAADGGTATDGGAAVSGRVLPEAETGLPTTHEPEPEHADHASYWPVVVCFAAFTAFLGVSGVNQGGFYPGLAVAGGLVTLGGFVGMAREDFYVPEPNPELSEQWPFRGVQNMKLGMWMFLGSDVVLFGGFIGSYLFLRVANGWQDWHHFIPADHVVLPGLINTYLLLTSSFAVVLALVAAHKNSSKGVAASLGITWLLGVGFLVNKGIEWLHLFHVHTDAFPEGWNVGTNVASSTFYLTTGLHGAHVIVGLIMLMYMIPRAWQGAYLDEKGEGILEYFGLYWHFVDIVWLFLFPLFYIL
jgi:cytochrome c oxidase subunit I+III